MFLRNVSSYKGHTASIPDDGILPINVVWESKVCALSKSYKALKHSEQNVEFNVLNT
jgi:hypothetical protein